MPILIGISVIFFMIFFGSMGIWSPVIFLAVMGVIALMSS